MLADHMIQIHIAAAVGGSLQLQVWSDCNCYQQQRQQVGHMIRNSAGHSFAKRKQDFVNGISNKRGMCLTDFSFTHSTVSIKPN